MPNYEPINEAPKLMAYLGEKVFLFRPLIMKREIWVQAIKDNEDLQKIDIYETPLCNVKISSVVVGVVVEKLASYDYELKVYRFDRKDDPPFNVDTYHIHERIDLNPHFPDYVLHATTSFDSNLQASIDETVVFENIGPQKDHHLSFDKLPEMIQEEVINMGLLNNQK